MYQTELQLARSLAMRAGELIKKNFALGMPKEWKADNSPVTVTDKAINQMVIEEIKKNFPEHSILGEEDSYVREGSEYAWLCDPIDGTIPFSHGAPNCMFLLALVKDGAPILGVMYDPFMDRFLHAIKGSGAFLNDQPIHVANRSSMKSSGVVICYRDVMDNQPNLLRYEVAKKGCKITDFSCVGYGEMLVACGEYVSTIFGYAKPYDVAAAKVIIEEAGGKVTDISGREQRYDRSINGCVMTNGILHQEFIDILNALNLSVAKS